MQFFLLYDRCNNMKKIISLLPIIALINCGPDNEIFILCSDSVRVKESIQRIIPAGSSVSQAIRIMEKNNFTCSRRINSVFSENGKVTPKMDFIYCDREEGLIISERWQAAIVYDGDRVRRIHVSYGLTGP
jgi:hypothetical protein